MEIPVITYRLIEHHGKRRIQIICANNSAFNISIKAVAGAKWNQRLNSWHIPDTVANRKKCGLGDEFSQLLLANQPSGWHLLIESNRVALFEFMNELKLKAYSENTIKVYRNEFLQLLCLLGNYSVESLTKEHIRAYLLYCIERLNVKERTLNQRINAIKFYFEKVLKRERFLIEIPRPQKHVTQPSVLSTKKIIKLFASTPNLKHRIILMLGYSAGLRVSEIVNLRIADIDSSRMMMYIRKANEKKDRMVMMSETLLLNLHKYFKEYKPKVYLLEGLAGNSYSIRSAQQVFRSATQKAGLSKKIGIHSLHHSFKTQLLEAGTDIQNFLDVLGHNQSKTSRRFTQIKRKTTTKIQSPLDWLN